MAPVTAGCVAAMGSTGTIVIACVSTAVAGCDNAAVVATFVCRNRCIFIDQQVRCVDVQ
jgi:hypothetical protein